jgi:thymidylate synthase
MDQMISSIEGQYLILLRDILDVGKKKQDRTGTGTISLFGRQIRHRMADGFPLLTTKRMPFKTIATELLWFLRGDTNIKFLVENGCHIWNGDAIKNYEKHNGEIDLGPFITKEEAFVDCILNKEGFTEEWGELGPIYGAQWREWYTKTLIKTTIKDPLSGRDAYVEGDRWIDQIQNLINDLKTNPDSRRLIVSAWNVGQIDQMVLPPCHYGFQVYTRELSYRERYDIWFRNNYETGMEKNYSIEPEFDNDYYVPTPSRYISLMWNQRSADVFLGLPFNIASYGLLLEMIAKEVNMVPDELIGNIGDAHLYLNHVDQAREQLTRQPYPLPRLNFNTEHWDDPFFEAIYSESFCKCLIEEDIQLAKYEYHPTIKAPLSN